MDSAEKNTLEKLIWQLWLQNAWGFLYSHILQILDYTIMFESVANILLGSRREICVGALWFAECVPNIVFTV